MTTCERGPLALTSRWTKPAAALTALAASISAFAAQALPIGLQAAPSFLLEAVRVLLVLWAATLLLLGVRLPRFTTASFSFFVSLLVAVPFLSGGPYLLVLLVLWLSVSVFVALNLYLPRLAMALAASWPLPAAYVAIVLTRGSFTINKPVLFGLLAVGVALGLALPRFGLALCASALGTVAGLLALPHARTPWVVVPCLAAALLWQVAGIRKMKRHEAEWPLPKEERIRRRRVRILSASLFAALLLAAAYLSLALFAPALSPADSVHAARLAALSRRQGNSPSPGFLFSPSNSFYLFGRATPVALLTPRGGWRDRFGVLVNGRDPSRDIHALRAVKDPGELRLMRKAARITSQAFTDAAPLIRPGMGEKAIERAITDSFAAHGATGLAFGSIVASGSNAVLPHYDENCAVLSKGLVVIDIGCMVDGYASDMTRTFPVNPKPSPPERRLMEVVAAAKRKAEAALKPGVQWKAVDQAARGVIEKAGFGPYFVHRVGHPVGIDVHDPSIRTVKAGMVLTIEPGIYVPEGAPVAKEYWNLGVRIEDTYLVTDRGAEALTHYPQLPRCAEETAEPAPPEGSPGGGEIPTEVPAVPATARSGATPGRDGP